MKINDLLNALKESDTERDTPQDAPPPNDDIVTGAQAAKILGVSMARIRQYKANGTLPAEKEPAPGQRDSWYKLSAVMKLKSSQLPDGELPRTGRPRD